MNNLWKRTKRITAGILILIIVITTMTFLVGTFAKSILARENPPPGRMVDVDELKMHIHCTGEGSPTVILEAGLDDFSIFWSQVQPEIAQSVRVCSYDRAGLGWSEPSPNPRTSETMVKELHILLVNAKLDPPYVLVGHSFGGALVRLYAHLYPDEVMGMVLADSAPDDVLAQYRAIAVSTKYFGTGIAENEAFESNLAEVRDANVSIFDKPLIVISRGYWDPMPGFSEKDNKFAWQMWQEMQVELLSLSSDSRQIIAGESEHNIHLQQPELVIDAIRSVVEREE
jgi:thioesterase domain-containing protein